MKKLEVTLRSDHLEAIINYALEQVVSSGGEINPLAWGDNENAIGERLTDDDDAALLHADVLIALTQMQIAVRAARGAHNCELMLLPLPAHYPPVVAYEPTDL